VRKAPTTYEDFISLELDGIRIGTVDQDSQRGAHAEQLQLGVHLAGLTAGAVDDAADVAELGSELVLERHLMMHAHTREMPSVQPCIPHAAVERTRSSWNMSDSSKILSALSDLTTSSTGCHTVWLSKWASARVRE